MATTKIGFISDLHIDVNREKRVKEHLLKYVNSKSIDYLVIAGDISSKHREVIKFFRKESPCKLKWVPGNHDLYSSNKFDSSAIYEEYKELEENLITHPLLIGNIVIIGDTGWYDYSYRLSKFSKDKCRDKRYLNMQWADKTRFKWKNMKDEGISQMFIDNLKIQIEKYSDKEIIVCTHTVPYKKFVEYKGYLEWDYFTSFIGTEKLGKLFDRYENIKTVVFGHTHMRYHEIYHGKECICRPLGYYFKEWTQSDTIKEIENCVCIKEVNLV